MLQLALKQCKIFKRSIKNKELYKCFMGRAGPVSATSLGAVMWQTFYTCPSQLSPNSLVLSAFYSFICSGLVQYVSLCKQDLIIEIIEFLFVTLIAFNICLSHFLSQFTNYTSFTKFLMLFIRQKFD